VFWGTRAIPILGGRLILTLVIGYSLSMWLVPFDRYSSSDNVFSVQSEWNLYPSSIHYEDLGSAQPQAHCMCPHRVTFPDG
jgi:hypothetical protein